MSWNFTFNYPTDTDEFGAGYVVTVVENILECMNSLCTQDFGDVYQAQRTRAADAADLTAKFTLSYNGACQ